MADCNAFEIICWLTPVQSVQHIQFLKVFLVQPHLYSLDSYKLYFDRTILTDVHIKRNRPDIIILNKQQKQAYLLDIAVPNSHNITQTYNTKINKYLELSVAMRNLWCLEKISILPLVISATGIVPQSLFKNLKILDLDNTLVVEIQKGIYIIILMSHREEIP
jgi:hypothetical protein